MDFAKILEETQKLVPTGLTSQPLLQSIDALHEQSKALRQQSVQSLKQVAGPTTTATPPTKSISFLAARGVDVEKHQQTVNSLGLGTAKLEDIENRTGGAEGQIKYFHEKAIQDALEESKRMTNNLFYKRVDDYLFNEWEDSKRKLQQALSKNRSFIPASHTKKSLEMFREPAFRSSSLTPLMKAYSNVVMTYNETVDRYSTNQEEPYELIEKFKQAVDAEEKNDLKRREVTSCFEILKYMVDEPSMMQKGVIPEIFTKNYEASDSSRKKLLLQGARTYLEQQYKKFILDRVAKKAVVTSSPPLKLDKKIIQDYTKDYFSVKQLDKSELIWAQIYFALRCGDVQLASEIVKDDPSISPSFTNLLKASQRLPSMQESGLEKTIFKGFCYYLLQGNSKLAELPSTITQYVIPKTEDFIWSRIVLFLTPSANSDSQKLFEKLQQDVNTVGPEYFSQSKTTLIYFKILLWTLQFEQAIAFLYTSDKIDRNYEIDAVHFGMVLYHYNLLRLPTYANKNYEKYPIFDTNDKSLNFALILKNYVGLFEATDPRDAASYCAFIREVEIEKQMLIDLIEDADTCSTLLGTIQKNGIIKKGYIDLLLSKQFGAEPDYDSMTLDNSNAYLETVMQDILTRSSEKILQKKNRIDVSIELLFIAYELRKDRKSSTAILNNIISRICEQLSKVLFGGENRAEIYILSGKIEFKLKEYMSKHHLPKYYTLAQLIRLMRFVDLKHEERYEDALNEIASIDILPTTVESAAIKAPQAKSLDEPIRSKLGIISQYVEECIKAREKQINDMNPQRRRDFEETLRELDVRRRALEAFTAFLK